MSTTIYNAFKLDESLADSLLFLQDCRKQLEPFIEKRTTDAQCLKLAEVATSHICNLGPYDWFPLDKDKDPCVLISRDVLKNAWKKDPLNWAYLLVRNNARLSEITQSALSVDDDAWFELYVCLFPMGLDKTIGIAYGPQEVVDKFLDLPGINEYSYWDNTDHPSNVKDEEWEERNQTWKKIMPSGIPSYDGFQYKLFCETTYYIKQVTEEQVNQYLQEHRDELVSKAAGRKLVVDYVKQATDTPGETSAISAGRAMRRAVEAKRKKKPEFLEACKEIEEKFPRSYDANFFLSIATEEEKPTPTVDINMSIEDMDLTVRAYNCLKRAQVNTVGDLAKYSVERLKCIRNIGQMQVREIIEKLASYHITLPDEG